MQYNRIYHPKLNKFISIKSISGKNLFKNYLRHLQIGGSGSTMLSLKKL